MLQIDIGGVIHNTKEMLVNVSKSVAVATVVKRVDFNSIKNAKLHMVIIPDNLATLLKIHSSLNYMEYKNNVKSYVLTKANGYIHIDQFVRLYLRVNKINNIDVNIPYNQFNKIDYKYLRYELNHIKNILCPYHKDSTYVWTREYDTYDGTFIGVCDKEEYGAVQTEATFTCQHIMDGISVTLNPLPKDEKFLIKYINNKNFKFDVYINNNKVDSHKVYTESLTEEQERVLQAMKDTVGDFTLDCLQPILYRLIVEQDLLQLDHFRFDEFKFETDMMVLIHYVYKDDLDKELAYQNMLYDLMDKMDRHFYFIEDDEHLYEDEESDSDEE